MKKIRLALVGLGLQGERLARAMGASTHSELYGVVSNDIARANAFAEKYGVSACFASLKEALEDPMVEAICIASPNHRHAKEIIEAARFGKPVFAEKPLALTIKEAKDIKLAARKGNAPVFVNFILRMSDEVQKARSAILRGDLGKIAYIEMHWSIGTKGVKALPPLPAHMQWREDPKKAGGGALVARGVHLFDAVRYVTGKEVSEAEFLMDNTAKTVDRTMLGNLRLEDGTFVNILTSKMIPDADNKIAIYGSEGTIVIRDIFGPDSWEKFNVRAFDELPRAIAGAKTHLAGLYDGTAVVLISGAALESASKRRAVKIPKQK